MRLLERLISSQMLSKRELSTTGISHVLYIRVYIIKNPFLNKKRRNLSYIYFLRSLMPNSTADQITFEKTPNYYRLPVVPDRIRNFNRTIKLVYVTCDPVRRTLSDFFHIHRKSLVNYHIIFAVPCPALVKLGRFFIKQNKDMIKNR